MKRVLAALALLLLLLALDELAIHWLAASDSAQVLLASWQPASALAFVVTLLLRIGLFLAGPALLVGLLVHQLLGRRMRR